MEEQLEKRFQELAERCWRQGSYIFTNFLDLDGQNRFSRVRSSLPPVPVTLFGGAEGCERQVLCFGDENFCGYPAAFPISCLKIAPLNHRFAEPLTHRDYLGALMALGMERELLGDIILREDAAYLFCIDRVAPYITDNFVQARRTVLTCEKVDALPAGDLFRLEKRTAQLTSERIDALIAHVYKFSRADAQALFPQGKIFVNGRLTQDSSYTPKPGDIVSIRGIGRLRYTGVESLSKKGKCNVSVEVFV